MSPRLAEAQAEADWLCSLVATNAAELKAASGKREFQLSRASFRLHAKDRNTLYRVSAQFQWFLKLTPPGDDHVGRERLVATVVGEVLGGRPEYCGAPVVRTGTDPSFVLASNVPGRTLSRLLVTKTWVPTRAAATQLTDAFGTLGFLLGMLHAHASIDLTAPPATKRPFDSLRGAAHRLRRGEPLSDAVAECLARQERSSRPMGFVHGNMRLDNVMVSEARIGFIDLEHSGVGSLYHDLSRPVAQLLLTCAAIGFPRHRIVGYLRSFLRRYEKVHAYDPRVLNDYVFARLAKYCIDNRKRVLPQRIGGMPILSSRLERLALALLHEGLEGAVPELRTAHACGH